MTLHGFHGYGNFQRCNIHGFRIAIWISHPIVLFTNVMVCFQTFLCLVIGTLHSGITLLPWGVLVQTCWILTIENYKKTLDFNTFFSILFLAIYSRLKKRLKRPLSLSSTLATTITTKGFWTSANDNDKEFFFLVLGVDRIEVESHYSCWVKKWNVFPLPLVQAPSLTTKQPTLKVSVTNSIRITLTIHSKTISITMMFTKHWMKLNTLNLC